MKECVKLPWCVEECTHDPACPARGPSAQALAEELSVECPTCKAEVGAPCQKVRGFLPGFIEVHEQRHLAFHTLAVEKVTSGEWELIVACDHGSHHWCSPCMDWNWNSVRAKAECAYCGEPLKEVYSPTTRGTRGT